jgi:hypothetical protein
VNPAEIRDALECAAEVFRGRLLLHHQYPLRGFGVGEHSTCVMCCSQSGQSRTIPERVCATAVISPVLPSHSSEDIS